ncbi:phosphoribosylaminoimidazole carboxylase chloroplastic [Phtheirospermum japonicum]|uniref:phosphoribosylaminoimidazole carboxylase n=1 Tax=Phtheirospermum japonicum TaxID=374723 RepID=A0A830BE35_9LAMI|nr:phosphoribosylaminoimidazole carboxylase chloroplastic [Phtheirospermum japonicum]
MHSLKCLSQSPPAAAITSAKTSFPFLKSAFSIPINRNMTSPSNNIFLKLPQTYCRASLEVQDASPRGSDLQVHGLSQTVVGVLGGGQLGRMLCEAASQLAIKVIILDPMENCPASNLCHYHMVGSYDDSATVQEFAKRCGVLTVEIEHVDAATLEKLERQGVDCQPKASTIRIIQDKYLQKVHFSRHAIPLPKFMEIDDLESAKKAGDQFGYPLMIKSKRLAYDGRGNAVAKNEDELSLAVNALGGYARGLYVEKWAPFVKVSFCWTIYLYDDLCVPPNSNGQYYAFFFYLEKENICHIVKSPADVSWKILKLATDVAYKAVNSLEGAGVFAVELFLTADGQHLRAVVGLPLGDPSMKTPAAIMYNILGEEEGEPGFLIANQLIGRALRIPGATIHWYDKPEMRKQRKMGHITFVGPSMGIIGARLKSMLSEEENEDQAAAAPRVGIIMGSDSDLPVMKDAAKILSEFNVPAEVRIVSAHRTPELLFSYASSARERGIQVIIAGAGGAAHLPGMVAALTPLPVIGVPVRASTLDGLDSLLSIVQMPRGVPVATVAINNATNAGLLAVRMLGISDIDLQARMAQYQEDRRDEVLVKGDKLEKGGWEDYLNS